MPEQVVPSVGASHQRAGQEGERREAERSDRLPPCVLLHPPLPPRAAHPVVGQQPEETPRHQPSSSLIIFQPRVVDSTGRVHRGSGRLDGGRGEEAHRRLLCLKPAGPRVDPATNGKSVSQRVRALEVKVQLVTIPGVQLSEQLPSHKP